MPKEIDGEKLFTQEELNQLISERLKRPISDDKKKSVISEYLASHGLDDDKFSELLTKDGKELELKLNKYGNELKAKEKELNQATELLNLKSKRLSTLLKETAITRALGDKADDRQKRDAVKLLMSDCELTDDEQVLFGGEPLDSEIDKWLEDRPYFKKPAVNTQNNRGAEHSDSVDHKDKPNPRHQVPFSHSGIRQRLESKLTKE
jgi:hypothetical protein